MNDGGGNGAAFFASPVYGLLPPDSAPRPLKYPYVVERLGRVSSIPIREPEPMPREHLVRVHTPAYVDAVLSATVPPAIERRIGFRVGPEVALRAITSVGGTWAAARHALAHGFGGNLAGGSHHAMPDGGAGQSGSRPI